MCLPSFINIRQLVLRLLRGDCHLHTGIISRLPFLGKKARSEFTGWQQQVLEGIFSIHVTCLDLDTDLCSMYYRKINFKCITGEVNVDVPVSMYGSYIFSKFVLYDFTYLTGFVIIYCSVKATVASL